MTMDGSHQYAAVSSRELGEFIRYLNDNSSNGPRPRFGKELEFMERNGFDSSRLLPAMEGWAEAWESPLREKMASFSNLDAKADFVRLLYLQLRDYFRAKFGLAPLTPEERSSWPLRVSMPPDFPRKNAFLPGEIITAPVHVITEPEAEDVARFMRRHFPEVVAYFSAVVNISQEQGYVYPDDVGRTGLVEHLMVESARSVLGVDQVGSLEKIASLIS